MELRTLKAQFAAEFIDIREAAQINDAKWEAFQLQYLNNTTRLTIDDKSRLTLPASPVQTSVGRVAPGLKKSTA